MKRIAVVSLMVVLGAAPLAAARSWSPSGCQPRFEAAREELIRRGFTPTSDRDTRRWLRVEAWRFGLRLALDMRASADGPATGYQMWVERSRVGHERWARRWHQYRRPVARGDHAAAEDRLVELWWTRSEAALTTTVSIVESESMGDDAQVKAWREMFIEVAKAAADDCMSGKPGAAAKAIP